jgi:hypothetical protein
MIDTKELRNILSDCLFKEDELVGGRPKEGLEWVPVQGIVQSFGFNKERLLSHKDDVRAMLNEMNPKFSEGLHFTQMPVDKDGNLWGEQRSAEELMCLGMALGWITLPLPRELWSLTFGVPYVIIDFNKMNNQQEG